jgi:ribosome-associated protein YbcJ (S4-like RNA binding protein)
VPKEVIPEIDGYLNSENIAIQQLLKSENIENDGGDIKL